MHSLSTARKCCRRILTNMSHKQRFNMNQEKYINGSSAAYQKVLTLDNMNPSIKNVQYAVRGPIVVRATQLQKELSEVFFYKTIFKQY